MQKRLEIRFRLPSPALVLAAAALTVALGGTAFAAGSAGHPDAKADTKLIKKLAPSLSVKHAKTADSATNATHATSADSATNATSSSSAASTPSICTPSTGSPSILARWAACPVSAVCACRWPPSSAWLPTA